jgi:hypothetical protein
MHDLFDAAIDLHGAGALKSFLSMVMVWGNIEDMKVAFPSLVHVKTETFSAILILEEVVLIGFGHFAWTEELQA